MDKKKRMKELTIRICWTVYHASPCFFDAGMLTNIHPGKEQQKSDGNHVL